MKKTPDKGYTFLYFVFVSCVDMSIRAVNTEKAECDTSEWFYSPDVDGWSPYQSVEYVVNQFCDDLARKGYATDISRQKVLYDMCTATCTMYYYEFWKRHRFIVGAPKRVFSRPRQWTNVLENQWNDFVRSRIVGTDYWETFWRMLRPAYWEQFLNKDSWRDVMQYLLPFYIHREMDILVDEEIVCKETNGTIVTWDDYEPEHEPDIRDADGTKKKKK
jgi:hypothetical protein